MKSLNIGSDIAEILLAESQKTFENADAHELHNATAKAVMQSIAEDWSKSREMHAKERRAYYFSAEYLMGRLIYNNLYCSGCLKIVKAYFAERGRDISLFDEICDVALGNGGLGRLAACFLDSAATHNIPLDGYGLRYRYGLFSQKLERGYQREYPDDWLIFPDAWSICRYDERIPVTMGDTEYIAVPYDMPVIGFGTDNIGTLRLFSCESENGFSLDRFNAGEYFLASHAKNAAEIVTAVLYPNDNTYEGKRLRLMQQYLLCSAGMQDILRRYKKKKRSLYDFAAHCAVQLNDTHPTVAIPELVRILMRENMSFRDALDIARNTFSYTNHTVMSEALEKWDRRLFVSVAPQSYDIICRINDDLHTHTFAGADFSRLDIVSEDTVHMANLASYVCCHINGVSHIHTEILKNSVLNGWYSIYPEKFSNKTNGITQRRFLGLCNPALTEFIAKKLGSDAFLTDLSLLSGLREHTDAKSIEEFTEIKYENKVRLAERVKKDTGICLPPDFIFDVQIKRLHEYKRQLMNALSIYAMYCDIKHGNLRDFTPTCFIFGAKAAPGYRRAKGIIKYINELANLINSDYDMQDKMRIVFVPDYNCSYAEVIIPAADISEQISPVGTEASGTGNMKLMLNGAVTLGTNDGANIEIAEQAGYENNYIFCRNSSISNDLHYDPKRIYDSDARIRNAVNSLIDGTFSDDGSGVFREIYNSLLFGNDADRFFVLRDFNEYLQARQSANADYRNKETFYRKCLLNTAGAGYFSADRTVKEYARDIWFVRE